MSYFLLVCYGISALGTCNHRVEYQMSGVTHCGIERRVIADKLNADKTSGYAICVAKEKK